MMKGSCLLLAAALAATQGSPYVEGEEGLYDYGEGEEKQEDLTDLSLQTPKFLSQSMKVLINEGDTIRLPCVVDRLEGFVMLWKKNGEIITVASQIIDKSVQLEETENGNHLVIRQAGPQAEGTYTCQISAYRPTELSHRVRIRVRPVLKTTPEEVFEGLAGSSASILCEATAGSPQPSLVWRKDNISMGEGGRLGIDKLSRHHAGVYICEGENGFTTSPVTKQVEVRVLFPPSVGVEVQEVRTDLGESQELVCQIYSNPEAEVIWSQDGSPVDSRTPSVLLNSAGSRHSLTLLSISESMLGKYSCYATNSLGDGEGAILVTGEAERAVVSSPQQSQEEDRMTLDWTVASRSRVTVFQVSVRPEGSSSWTQHRAAASQRAGGTSYTGTLILTGLEPATRYSVLISSKNAFGYNSPGEAFIFATQGVEPRQMPATSKANSWSYSSTAAFLIPLVTVTVTVMMRGQ